VVLPDELGGGALVEVGDSVAVLIESAFADVAPSVRARSATVV
jgi:hypothetical protein